jgi:Bacterial SH3 domain
MIPLTTPAGRTIMMLRIRHVAFGAALVATMLSQAQPASADLNRPARGTTIQAAERVPLRSGPSASDSVIVAVPAGHTATVLSPTPSNGFYHVNYQGNVGWIRGIHWNVVGGLWVNGHRLNPTEAHWVRWVAGNTVAKLDGSRNIRIGHAARVTWWSLKEGVLDIGNVHPYSNCQGRGHVGPLVVCPSGSAWQVGIAAIQVPNFSLGTAEATARQLYPNRTVRGVLSLTATTAGYAAGTPTHDAIANSTGQLRNSWLQRNHAVGVTLNAPVVYGECVDGSRSWCYSTGWPTSARYAPDKAAALRSIREIMAIFYALAP